MSEGTAVAEEPTWTLMASGEGWEVPPCNNCGEQLWIVSPEYKIPEPGQHIAELTCSVCGSEETALLLMQS